MRPVPRGRRLPALFGSSSDLRSAGIDPLYAGADPDDALRAEADSLVGGTCAYALTADRRLTLEAHPPLQCHRVCGPEAGRRNSAEPAASRAAAQLPNT